ncbi:oxidoreductase [Nocardia vermiculata]|uniref:Oxidoreductase n=1 Tax=Nocardia vermiculata TaxID=257274 RepID=A0A846XW46_9NOCA|nr:oxidoreductase [Nocardia vermiculata]NKY49611.1 oxidoreductase [Nocardia vermiculata]
MGLLDRFRRGSASAGPEAADARYLADWVRTHAGVEAFIEPKTAVTDVTAVLVAADGEWTRRVVGERGARQLASRLKIPVYDAARTGYPQRMRDHDARKRIERKRALEAELRDLPGE